MATCDHPPPKLTLRRAAHTPTQVSRGASLLQRSTPTACHSPTACHLPAACHSSTACHLSTASDSTPLATHTARPLHAIRPQHACVPLTYSMPFTNRMAPLTYSMPFANRMAPVHSMPLNHCMPLFHSMPLSTMKPLTDQCVMRVRDACETTKDNALALPYVQGATLQPPQPHVLDHTISAKELQPRSAWLLIEFYPIAHQCQGSSPVGY